MIRVRGSCVAIDGAGVLLRGASGSGKSDLALRLVMDGGTLVSDDYTEITVAEGRLRAAAPETLRGLLEVRGLGVLRVTAAAQTDVVAAVDLVAPDAVPRMPDETVTQIAGVEVAFARLAPFEVSAAGKVRFLVALASNAILRVP